MQIDLYYDARTISTLLNTGPRGQSHDFRASRHKAWLVQTCPPKTVMSQFLRFEGGIDPPPASKVAIHLGTKRELCTL